ncbi:hypothetical protein SAMN05443144_11948 [Fodinibius roseus]|uniref:Uncharacterized protein n=1 Tax=Fodinibius roseus TaxID=1194090 RepID=A0A1M5H629_9BACT|nr:hypothetical protein SAMN05443144_11948 [Fodinibius roseus]
MGWFTASPFGIGYWYIKLNDFYYKSCFPNELRVPASPKNLSLSKAKLRKYELIGRVPAHIGGDYWHS